MDINVQIAVLKHELEDLEKVAESYRYKNVDCKKLKHLTDEIETTEFMISHLTDMVKSKKSPVE